MASDDYPHNCFKVGDRVRWSQSRLSARVGGYDKKDNFDALVKRTDTEFVVVTVTGFDHVRLTLKCANTGRSYGDNHNFFEKIMPPSIDLTKPVTTRDGFHADVLPDKGPPDRPILARVYVDHAWRTYSYPATGQFYPGFDQPIDLVNP